MRPTHHLRVFVISLVLIGLALVGVLFGVQLEAVVPATGIVTAADLLEIRARLSGLVEPGWYEGRVVLPGEVSCAVRLDADGNGLAETSPAGSPYRVIDAGQRLAVQGHAFHRLQPGDVLWPGQPLALVRDEVLRLQLLKIEDQIDDVSHRGEPSAMLIRERDRLRHYHAQGVLRAPTSGQCWLVLEVRAAPFQRVEAGDVLVTIVAADPRTQLPCRLIARLEVEEKHWAGVAAGDGVRLYSNSHNPRHFGRAAARIDRLEPWGEPTATGERRFHAVAPITEAPFALPLGSSFQAEIVTGRKPVYRIILEH